MEKGIPMTCGQCDFYDPESKKCGLYLSVQGTVSKRYMERTDAEEKCRYSVRQGEIVEQTPEGILSVLLRNIGTFWERPCLEDIDPEFLHTRATNLT